MAATVHNSSTILAPLTIPSNPHLPQDFPLILSSLVKTLLRKLVLSVPKKCCSLDLVATKVVEECLDELVPLLTVIINQSLQSGVFPDVWKEAPVTPTLKKYASDSVAFTPTFALNHKMCNLFLS